MKRNWRLIVLTVLGLTVFILGIIILANQAQISKNQSLGENDLVAVVEEYQRKAKFNQGVFPELLKIAEEAKYNREAIKTAAYILANVGFHTLPVMEIAKIAGSADHEVGYLDDLLEVTIIYGGASDTIVNLARQAVNNEISEADLSEKITFYRNHSQAKTIDEAVTKNDSELASVIKKIEQIIKDIQQQNNNQRPTENNTKNNQFIAEIKGYMSNGKDNHFLDELLKIAANAEFNHSVIRTAADFLSREGSFNNWTVLNIARLAGGAGREIKQLNGLLEVSITYGGDSLTIIELAIRAVKDEISVAELENRISYYRNNSESKTIDEAMENNKKAISGI